MKTVRKEWLGFFLCLSLTCALTLAILWNARTEFRRQVIQSELFLVKAEIKRMTEELEVTFMERSLTFLDLGMPDLVHNERNCLSNSFGSNFHPPDFATLLRFEWSSYPTAHRHPP